MHNENEEKLKRRLKKLHELAKRGVDGEKETAERMFQKLLEKHKISIDEITDDQKKRTWFRHGVYPQRKLLVGIICAVCDVCEYYTRGRFSVGVDCSEYQRTQIELQFSIYKSALKRQIEATVIAFIWKNELHPKTTPQHTKREPSAEQLALIRAAEQMYDSIEKTKINPQLQNNGATQ